MSRDLTETYRFTTDGPGVPLDHRLVFTRVRLAYFLVTMPDEYAINT
jgi:hypothetical protein